jgi:hypothetical protein
VSWNLRDVITVLWLFNTRSDGNFDVVVILRRRSEGGMNNFVTEDASVINKSSRGEGLAGMGVSPGHLRVTRGAHIECV